MHRLATGPRRTLTQLREGAESRQHRSSADLRSSFTKSASGLWLIVWLMLMPRLSAGEPAAAPADTLTEIVWLLEQERYDHRLALLACQSESDSLRIELRYKERVQELKPEPSSIKPWMVFVAGIVVGGGYAVLVMHAVD